MMLSLPVILHIPHSSTSIPEPYGQDYVLSPAELEREKLRLTDMYTDELYQLPGAQRAVFPVSRFLVDAERFDDDALESMAARGMGALYTVTTDLKPLRHMPSPGRRKELMDRYYYPHHEGLNAWADRVLAEQGRGLLVDCHSYPSRVLPYEMETTHRPRPQIGIGTDAFHTPPELAKAVVSGFEKRGYEVGLDSPFSGTLTPGRHFGKSRNIHAFMIEVRKDLYMDELTGEKLEGFAQVRDDITQILENATKTAF